MCIGIGCIEFTVSYISSLFCSFPPFSPPTARQRATSASQFATQVRSALPLVLTSNSSQLYILHFAQWPYSDLLYVTGYNIKLSSLSSLLHKTEETLHKTGMDVFQKVNINILEATNRCVFTEDSSVLNSQSSLRSLRSSILNP